jgi:hypothetical protein
VDFLDNGLRLKRVLEHSLNENAVDTLISKWNSLPISEKLNYGTPVNVKR